MTNADLVMLGLAALVTAFAVIVRLDARLREAKYLLEVIRDADIDAWEDYGKANMNDIVRARVVAFLGDPGRKPFEPRG